jgi:hypothetical protein
MAAGRKFSRSAAIGLAAAPLPVAVILVVISPITATLNWYTFLGWTLVFYLYATIPNIVFGLPAFLMLAPRNLIRWWTALSVGGVIGLLASAILARPANIAPRYLALYAALGAISGLTFWCTWKVAESLNQHKPANSRSEVGDLKR